MPTPFSHLAYAQRLLRDEALPETIRHALDEECSAFLLGSVAADARVGNRGREATHFYHYTDPINRPLWRVMLDRYPALETSRSSAHRVFLAGYVAHLAIDETWALEMVRPHFVHNRSFDSGGHHARFLALHLILSYMDRRDLAALEAWQPPTLLRAQPDGWLPFMPDAVLADWRDFIGGQIIEDGNSKTLEIFGARIGEPPEKLRRILDTPEQMQARLWDHVPHERLAAVEAHFYTNARDQLRRYVEEYA